MKITDFGLSKITPEHATDGIDLTSQGSGTYWYLPPECFSPSARISSKVDVFSAGCVLYQMIYGRKPFGHNMSPETFVANNAYLEVRNLQFPKTDSTKKDAALTPTQEFIKACLQYDPADRPDILTILQHKYFSVKMS